MRRKILNLTLLLLVFLLSGCGPGLISDSPPAISGTLIYSSRPIEGAEVSLVAYQDEDCVKLARGVGLSESEKQQLDECSSDYAITKSNIEGDYLFSDVEPGWYSIMFDWDLNDKPDSPHGIEWINNFLVYY